eukprot:Gb_03373 [translate_table: standard]
MEATWSCWECLEWLILVIALQLATVAYGVNSFFEPLEDLEGYMVKLLECLRNPGYRLGIITGYSRFMHRSCLELLGMLGMVDPHYSIAIGNICIWSEFIFCATERPGRLHGEVIGVPKKPWL